MGPRLRIGFAWLVLSCGLVVTQASTAAAEAPLPLGPVTPPPLSEAMPLDHDTGRWAADFGFGYGESLALGGEAAARAHIPYVRMRGAFLVGAGSVGLEGFFPLAPMLPHGQVGAGLSLGWRWGLGEATRIPSDGGPLSSSLSLLSHVSGGWTYVISDVSEGYISLSDDAVSFAGPYARGEVELCWSITRVDRGFGVDLGVAAGTTAILANYEIPETEPAWRLGIDGLLTTGLRW